MQVVIGIGCIDRKRRVNAFRILHAARELQRILALQAETAFPRGGGYDRAQCTQLLGVVEILVPPARELGGLVGDIDEIAILDRKRRKEVRDCRQYNCRVIVEQQQRVCAGTLYIPHPHHIGWSVGHLDAPTDRECVYDHRAPDLEAAATFLVHRPEWLSRSSDELLEFLRAVERSPDEGR